MKYGKQIKQHSLENIHMVDVLYESLKTMRLMSGRLPIC